VSGFLGRPFRAGFSKGLSQMVEMDQCLCDAFQCLVALFVSYVLLGRPQLKNCSGDLALAAPDRGAF
jgi:hypothetical protein